jgi:hypothetical protein
MISGSISTIKYIIEGVSSIIDKVEVKIVKTDNTAETLKLNGTKQYVFDRAIDLKTVVLTIVKKPGYNE